jgi:F-type H+-transporting ATPase subunit gamma
MNRAKATKPYTEKLAELVADITEAAREVAHPLMNPKKDVKKSAIVIITSKRGLCGGYNANVLRTAVEHIRQQDESGIENDVYMVGKKGIAYFRFLKRPMVEQITHLDESPRFGQIEVIANKLMDRFIQGEIASAHVAYMRFYSVGKQRPEVLQLLPITRHETEEEEEAASDQRTTNIEYEFSPEPKALLDDLLPATVRVELFQCFIDATVSEHLARMVAMKAATDAAGDMIRTLTQQYNRARQTAITMELLDIVGGANALQ